MLDDRLRIRLAGAGPVGKTFPSRRTFAALIVFVGSCVRLCARAHWLQCLPYPRTHFIPAAEANLISYLWPVEVIAPGAVLKLFKLRMRHVVGLCLGFTGALVLMGGGALSLSLTGISLALLSGLSWALYCVFRLIWKQPATRILQRGCAISTVLCVAFHFACERTVAPDLGALASSAAVGIIPLALGNLVWDEGFRRGDSRLLAVMAYATPLCSALLLISLGLESFSTALAGGAISIVIAGWLSHAEA